MTALPGILARYNRWANERLFTDLATLTPEQLDAKSGVNFGSIRAILGHGLMVDHNWLFRLTGEGEPFPFGAMAPWPDFTSLRCAREREDGRLVAFIEGLNPARLPEIFHYTDHRGRPQSGVLALLLMQLYGHQMHHRGQVHALMAGLGREPKDLDLLIFLHEQQAPAT